jgi:hypothetical protein
MNYLSIKTTILALAIFSISSVQAEWKFGVSLGLTNIDYELSEAYADVGGIDVDSTDDVDEDAELYTNNNSYSAPEFIIDLRNGKHAFSYKIANGDISGWDDSQVPAIDPADYNLGYSNDVEREEWTFSYAYSLSNNWSLSVGAYEGTVIRDYFRNYNESYNPGTISAYTWTTSNDGITETTSKGTFAAIAYQDKISDNVFWFAKVGYQDNELISIDNWTYTDTFTAEDAGYGAYVIDFLNQQYGMDNGVLSYNRGNKATSEGSSTVIGLGFVYAFNASDTLTLEFESKAYSYDAGTYSATPCTSTTTICDLINPQDFDAISDESASYVTLRYRHSF